MRALRLCVWMQYGGGFAIGYKRATSTSMRVTLSGCSIHSNTANQVRAALRLPQPPPLYTSAVAHLFSHPARYFSPQIPLGVHRRQLTGGRLNAQRGLGLCGLGVR